MPRCDTLILNPRIIDGTGEAASQASVALRGDRILAIGDLKHYAAETVVDGEGLVLAPGFIDVHTHDDLAVIQAPEMLPKLSQGVTTVIVGNCGVSAAPVRLSGAPPDPMNLLGDVDAFCYPTFAHYAKAIDATRPAVNVAALVGHTALRNNHMDRLDRAATAAEIQAMRAELSDALEHGAIGLSSGLAYGNAFAATPEEVRTLAEPLGVAGAVYTTHMRSEGEAIQQAIEESLRVGQTCKVPVIISHLKCAGIANWGRSSEVLATLDTARTSQNIGWDCYPYAAGSSTLDLRQVDERVKITITWSTPHAEMAGRTLAEIADAWKINQVEAARRLQPAGAIYHSISEEDMRHILQHPATMIGSDGLPNDPRPHPRLWGTFPRVLGRYCREQKMFSLTQAIHKMTGMPARRFGLRDRGIVRAGCFADLVLFNPETIRDNATFDDPICAADGIEAVWVNGIHSYENRASTGQRSGRFLPRQSTLHAANLEQF
jgi:N-acyl-D-aspartate/D-glutamate deacylase